MFCSHPSLRAPQMPSVSPAGGSPAKQGTASKRQLKWRRTVPVLQIAAERERRVRSVECVDMGWGRSVKTLHFVLAVQGLVQTCLTSKRKQEKVQGVKRLSITHWGTAQVHKPKPEKRRQLPLSPFQGTSWL